MSNPDVLIRPKRTYLVLTIPSCILAASLLFFGCGPSENPSSTANNPSPEATGAGPSAVSNTSEYSVGDKITFGADGNSKNFKVSGWSEAEAKHSWTNGGVSVLAMRIPPA